MIVFLMYFFDADQDFGPENYVKLKGKQENPKNAVTGKTMLFFCDF